MTYVSIYTYTYEYEPSSESFDLGATVCTRLAAPYRFRAWLGRSIGRLRGNLVASWGDLWPTWGQRGVNLGQLGPNLAQLELGPTWRLSFAGFAGVSGWWGESWGPGSSQGKPYWLLVVGRQAWAHGHWLVGKIGLVAWLRVPIGPSLCGNGPGGAGGVGLGGWGLGWGWRKAGLRGLIGR